MAQMDMYKTELREQRSLVGREPRLQRMASILNFSQTVHPSALLILLQLVPLTTLIMTYSISSTIYIPVVGTNRTETVFQQKSEWCCFVRQRELSKAVRGTQSKRKLV